MATIKLILQEPYKRQTEQEKENKKPKALNPLETRLYCFLVLDHDHFIKVKTEFKIYPEQWDFKTQLKKEITGHAAGNPEVNVKIREFNDKLRNLKKDIEDKYWSIIKQFPDIPFEQVARILKEYGKGIEIPFSDSDKGFFEILDLYVNFLKGTVAPGTIKKYVTLKNSLNDFIEVNPKYKEISFSMIDHIFYDAYTKYLRNQKPRGRQKTRPEGKQEGLLIDTVGKYVECLKTFLSWAEKRYYNKSNVYKSFPNFSKAEMKLKKQRHDIVTLSLHELQQFYEHDFSNNPSMDRVRDMFCFECFTGQRWSDIQQFDKSQLQDDVWVFDSQKTKEPIEIDLTGFASPALDILKKYNYRFPVISNQKFNDYLKDAAKLAGIDTPITIRRYVGASEIRISAPKNRFLASHAARRTCVSILLNECGLSPVHVMEITGHSDYKTLKKYIDKDRQARRDAMSKTKPVNKLMTIVKSKAG